MTDDREIRARVASGGVDTLSDAELLSVVIREGTKTEFTVATAEKLLSDAGGDLAGLASMGFGRLRIAHDLGASRAASLVAALEIGVRMNRQQQRATLQVVANNEDVISIFRPLIAGLPHEEFWVLYLNASNRVIDRVRVSQGGVAGTVVDHKLIVKRAVELLASSLILVHNHPSGDAAPSDEDLEVTGRLTQAAALFDIAVLDHLILTPNTSFSFRHHGKL